MKHFMNMLIIIRHMSQRQWARKSFGSDESHVDHISSLMNNTSSEMIERTFFSYLQHVERMAMFVPFVLVPPRIISHAPEHMHLTVREGRDARFSCMAFGRPVPVIVWHVNGLSRPALASKSMLFAFDLERWQNFFIVDILSHFLLPLLAATQNESILLLRNVSRLDAGRVDCSASNTLSTVNRQFLLHVKCEFLDRSRQHTSWTRIFFNFR